MTKSNLYVIENKPALTCRHNCMFFDDSKGNCIAYPHKKQDYINPRIAAHCDSFENIYDTKYDEQKEHKPMSVLEIALLNLLTTSNDISIYPQQPIELDLSEEGFEWYISPDNSFGCWIKNESTVPTLIYSASSKQPINAIRYRSLIPLHDHACSDNLKNIVVWYVDTTGFGQYSLYFNGTVQQLNNLHF